MRSWVRPGDFLKPLPRVRKAAEDVVGVVRLGAPDPVEVGSDPLSDDTVPLGAAVSHTSPGSSQVGISVVA
jgi:hypothetical protein